MDTTTQFIIEHKLYTLHSLQSTGMSWWVSSVVFCASIIGAVWYHRKQLASHPEVMKSLRFAIGFFFITVIAYGVVLAVHCMAMRADVLSLKGSDVKMFGKEFVVTTIAYAFGTTSFILIAISWFTLLRHMKTYQDKSTDPKGKVAPVDKA